MLLKSPDLPPFIHAYAFQESDSEGGLLPPLQNAPESLAACRSIVQMYSVKTKQTSPFLWRTVASERKRLEEEVSASHPDYPSFSLRVTILKPQST
jgi:hypothetical protein